MRAVSLRMKIFQDLKATLYYNLNKAFVEWDKQNIGEWRLGSNSANFNTIYMLFFDKTNVRLRVKISHEGVVSVICNDHFIPTNRLVHETDAADIIFDICNNLRHNDWRI